MTIIKSKKILIITVIGFLAVLVVFYYNSSQVTAQIVPVTVNISHLAFGNVFPGEELQGEFIVTYVEEEGSGIAYRLIQKPKPCPEENPDCGPGGFYKNLCPYLTKVSEEGEGDTEENAFIGPEDSPDTWTIYFKVPAIFGYVSQDHTGGVINEAGDYGCDIAIDLIDWNPCDAEKELVLNKGFEMPAVTHTDKWNIFPSVVENWTVEWRSDIPNEWGGYTKPELANLEFHRGVNGWLPAEGSQYVELDSDWYGPGHPQSGEPASVKIYQDIPTIPGETYNIKYSFSPRPSTGANDNILELSWDGEVKATTTATGGSNTNWTQYSYSFVAASNTTRLQFTDLGTANSLGTFLDNISVKCVPVQ